MFRPPHFREDDPSILQGMMLDHPFATMVSGTADGLLVDHLPLLCDPTSGAAGRLRGHISAGNPLLKSGHTGMDVTAIFKGPHGYISPSWYPSKKDHGKVVPTWNYVAAHAHGRLHFHRDPDWCLQIIDDLTNRYEETRDNPWAVSDMPPEFLTRQLRGIVGIEIEIVRLEGQRKLSQNKSQADRQGVLNGLRAEGDHTAIELADAMQIAFDQKDVADG